MKKFRILLLFLLFALNSFAKIEYSVEANSIYTVSEGQDSVMETYFDDSKYFIEFRYYDEIENDKSVGTLVLFNENKEKLRLEVELFKSEDGENSYGCYTSNKDVLEFLKRTNALTAIISDGTNKVMYFYNVKGFESELKNISI